MEGCIVGYGKNIQEKRYGRLWQQGGLEADSGE